MLRAFRTERIAPTIWTGRAVLWEWISRCVRIHGVHFDTSPGGNAFNVSEVEVGVLPLEQCDTKVKLAFYVFGVPAGNKGLTVSVLLMALYTSRCARCAARMF